MCRCEDFPCCGHDDDYTGNPYDGTDISDQDFWDDGPDTDLLNEF